MRVLFLYTELADYFLKACEKLAAIAEVHIVRWPINNEAPFKFTNEHALKIYDRESYDTKALLALSKSINPDILVCSGWIDKGYLSVVNKFRTKIPTVITLDTQWRGDLKQQLALIPLKLLLKRLFSHAWVPGQRQVVYAQRLGFSANQIHTGFYCCDYERFNAIYSKHKINRSTLPKRFIFVGRYYDFKGVNELWTAFSELKREGLDWELWCLGKGNIEPDNSEGIRHFGFVQPHELEPFLENTGVFILPSRFEPWAVVVHEFALAGYPLILSDAVGSSEQFLLQEKNGFQFKAGDVDDLKGAMKKMAKLSSEELILMAQESHRLAEKINPDLWTNTLKRIYDSRK